MASGLKAKLSAISSAASAPAKPTIARHPMERELFHQAADPRLYALEEVALNRIGLEGDWPGIERCLFLDTETTGLSRGVGTIVFMLGLGYVQNGQFVVEQFTLGDYPDEPLMVKALLDALGRFDVVVSFNGNAFDLPLLENRAVMCRMSTLFEDHTKLDLMHPARRLWKRRLASCRLSELEGRVLGLGRENDLPGSEAPARFFHYLETGDRSLLDEVKLHNRLDILSLGNLLIRLCEAFSEPENQIEQLDLYSMGRALERRGELGVAERCYRLACLPEASLSLSMLRKRAGDGLESERIWLGLAEKSQMGTMPLIELSKLYEHKRREPARALECAGRALLMESDPAKRASIRRRMDRLEKKTHREGG